MLSLTWTLAVTDWKLRFYGSVLGYVWTLARPFAFFGVIYVVFTEIASVGGEIENYGVYILFGLVLFSFFAETTGNCVTCLVDAREPAAQDALPAHRDPAVGRAHVAAEPRHDAGRGVRLHARERRSRRSGAGSS